MCRNCKALADAIDRYIAKADDNLASELKSEGYTDPEGTVKHIESMEEGVEEALLEETDYIATAAEQAEDLQDFRRNWRKIKSGDGVALAITAVTRQEFTEMMPELVDQYIQMTDRDLHLETISKRTTAWIKDWSTELGRIMKLDSHDEIEKILTEELEAGHGVAEFTRRIQESGIRDEYYRARRVAVTESLRAHSVAQQEAFMQSPVITMKQWTHSGDYRIEPRQNHVAMDGQRVQKQEPYTLAGADGGIYYPMYPRDTSLPPGESINCHCISEGIPDPDILGYSPEELQAMQDQAVADMDADWERELDEKNHWKNVPNEDRPEWARDPDLD